MLFLETGKPQQNVEHLGRGGGWAAGWQSPPVARARGATFLQNLRLDSQKTGKVHWSLGLHLPGTLSQLPVHSPHPPSSVLLPVMFSTFYSLNERMLWPSAQGCALRQQLATLYLTKKGRHNDRSSSRGYEKGGLPIMEGSWHSDVQHSTPPSHLTTHHDPPPSDFHNATYLTKHFPNAKWIFPNSTNLSG